MQINSPGIITSRLCAGVKIGAVTISIEYAKRPGREGRTRWRYYLDREVAVCANGSDEHSADDLQSGCQGGNLQDGLESLLSFLGAAGESYAYEMRTGAEPENVDLFPPWVNRWAYQESDELSMLRIELEEGGIVLFDES